MYNLSVMNLRLHRCHDTGEKGRMNISTNADNVKEGRETIRENELNDLLASPMEIKMEPIALRSATLTYELRGITHPRIERDWI